MLQSLRGLPVGLFGALMALAGLGLAGLGLARRRPRSFLPVKSPPPGIPRAIGLLGVAVPAPAFLLKGARHAGVAAEELGRPAALAFAATLPVGLTLLAAGVQPYS